MGLSMGPAAHPDAEYEAFGEPTDERMLAERLDEGLEVLAGLWSGNRFSHSGRHFHADRVIFLPQPRQRPHIPVWVACTWPHRRPLRRAARWDGVVAARPTPDGSLERMEPTQVAELAAGIGRLRSSGGRFDLAVVNPVPARPAGGCRVRRRRGDLVPAG